MDCARKHSRHGHRDATMVLVAYRHGLRASETCDLQWHQIELAEGRMHVHRVKRGIPSVHPIRGDEMRGLRKLRREHPSDAYVFNSERGGPIQRLGEAAKMPFAIHPHMLRHACGYKLANDGYEYPRLAALSRPQKYPTHGALHRPVARSLPRLWKD